MSFGTSVGDIVIMFKLIAEITSCLQDSGGASAEYEEVVRHINVLKIALKTIDQQGTSEPPSVYLQQIQIAIGSCQRPIEQFLEKATRFGKRLGRMKRSRSIGDVVAKLQWTFSTKKEVKYLLDPINSHVTAITVLLTSHNVELQKAAEANNEARSNEICLRVDNNRELLEDISTDVVAHSATTQSMRCTLEHLFRMFAGDPNGANECLGQVITECSSVAPPGCVKTNATAYSQPKKGNSNLSAASGSRRYVLRSNRNKTRRL